MLTLTSISNANSFMALVDSVRRDGWQMPRGALNGYLIADGLDVEIIELSPWDTVDGYLEIYYWGNNPSPELTSWARRELANDAVYGHVSRVFTYIAQRG